MILLIVILTILITLALLTVGLCFAAHLGDLQQSDDPPPRSGSRWSARSNPSHLAR